MHKNKTRTSDQKLTYGKKEMDTGFKKWLTRKCNVNL